MDKFHICFGLSAYGTLRSVFRKQNLLQTESIICIEDDFSFETIDITAFSVNCDYKVRNIDGNEVSYVLKSVGALPPKLVMDAYQVKKNMPANRVHELIKQGLLQYQGELMPLRRLEIRLT
ncbi:MULTISPECIES: DUF1835 domain-containing protein [Brevibacillus]|uniref:DUF1835 domain-containing protein n=1 Tax=Brevibacillus TaxID=55080 RepID=UPI000D1110DC|nr:MULTISPECIES: DUF1835 domain-containing protein [Brevibacillus]PSJ69788.1 hypothetical protein C7J99_08470 [Brevibacillus brevis]RED25935.1 uncharacterized protein DUF1835 [Brevibacillus brevis]TQK74476.1 uncharacterized protein DUF1835 [Brevibacillus sp. AG162]VEF88225.1 Uncharacterised protein [Brevibacillus brevis]GEC89084.1 hypothetical protein BBR01nite_14150 [Brevibacillus brevis]